MFFMDSSLNMENNCQAQSTTGKTINSIGTNTFGFTYLSIF
jgi:hypothetical protein